MILRVTRRKVIDNGNCGSTELITEIYDGSGFINQNGCMNIDNKKSVCLTDYDKLDEITDEMAHYEVLDAFLMNNEGKTIDRIV